MGWNQNALFVKTPQTPCLLADLGILNDAQELEGVDFQTALSCVEMEQVCTAQTGHWFIVLGLPVAMADDDVLADFSKASELTKLVLCGAASTYGFYVYRKGHVTRSFVEQEGKVIADEGDHLAEEDGLEELYMEARVLQIVERLTLPMDSLEELSFTRYTGLPPCML